MDRRIARSGVQARAILLGFAIAAMAVAIYGGLLRLGLPVPEVAPLADIHGPLMICGVFGTLISLERAVAIGLWWPYAAPSAFALGAATMVAGTIDLAALLAVFGALVLFAASLWIASQQRALFTALLAMAALMLLTGCAFWLTGSEVRDLVGWWLGFLVLTIAAERLELSRIAHPTRLAQGAFVGAVGLLATGAALGLEGAGGRLLGAGFLAITVWLARYDMARMTIGIARQPRFMATAMLAGYTWLGIAGWILLADAAAPFAYDSILHAVLIGFVLSIVFGHALIIFPAIVGVTLRYRAFLYLPLALLHLSVAMRIAGNLLELAPLRIASGPLTAVSLLAFAALLAAAKRAIR